ncbi:MAG: C_GCAxxG_C_C family protein [Clostridia bacterium]|nr:C_GCAxxG_C_C family protein [Clostridia bacterium]
MTRAERAKEYFLQGYACSQAVAMAFEDLTSVSKEEIAKSMLPFGGGLGRLRLTCGAVSGMAAAYGMICAKSENTPENKKLTYAAVQRLCGEFQRENGSLICADLLSGQNLQVAVGGVAEERTQEYYKKRPCAELVYHAAEILEKYLRETGAIV